MGKRERDVEKYLRSKIKSMGGACYKWRAIDHKGVPDRICILPWMGIFFVEVKRDGKRPTPIQSHTFDEIRDSGGAVFVVEGIEGVDAMVEYVYRFKLEGNDGPA